jgi:predicted GH43/DUF377 family glycosyl hydrolase
MDSIRDGLSRIALPLGRQLQARPFEALSVDQLGQVLFDPHEPGSPIARCTEPLPLAAADVLEGHVDRVCFAEGLATFAGTWFLYYGMADSRVRYAIATFSQ